MSGKKILGPIAATAVLASLAACSRAPQESREHIVLLVMCPKDTKILWPPETAINKGRYTATVTCITQPTDPLAPKRIVLSATIEGDILYDVTSSGAYSKNETMGLEVWCPSDTQFISRGPFWPKAQIACVSDKGHHILDITATVNHAGERDYEVRGNHTRHGSLRMPRPMSRPLKVPDVV